MLPRTTAEIAAYREAVDRELGIQSLARFTRLVWPEIETNPLSWNWHIDAICDLLEAVDRGEIRRLLINVPPGCMKSLLVSTLFPAWTWNHKPTKRFIVSTYAQKLSNKNARLHRDIINGDTWKRLWPLVRLSKEASRKVEHFTNSHQGFRFSTSVTGSLTGYHGDVLIWDDLIKAQDAQGLSAVNKKAIGKANEFLFETLVTRQANPKTTAMIGIMQRLHYGDPSQRCIDQGDHVVLTLPMEYDPRRHCEIRLPSGKVVEDPRTEEKELLWPGRFDQEEVDKIRQGLGTLGAAAQLDQNPAPLEGAVFNKSWFDKRWTEAPDGRYIMTVDCTFKDTDASDYVAIQVWAASGPNYYLIDATRGRWDIKATCAHVERMKERHPRVTGIYVEDKANGPAVVQILTDKITGIREWSPGRSAKEERASAVSPLVETNTWFPPADLAPWMGDYVTEMTQFPRGVNDDQVDATSMALLILHGSRARRQRAAYGQKR